MSDFYDETGAPATSSSGSSAAIRAEFALIGTATRKAPPLTGNGDNIVKINAGGTAMESVAQIAVSQGGTGAGTFTDGGILLGSGTGAITALAVLSDGEMIVGDGTTDPAIESGATLRTSIGVGTGDSPTFAGLTLTADLTVANGGTGASTFTDGGVLLGSGTGAITAMAVLADGAIIIGDGTTDPVALTAFSSSTGTLKVANGGSGQSTFLDGQIMIGNTSGNTLTKAAISAGDGIVVANGNGTITIANNASYKKNLIIGGNFDTNPWQRGTSFTSISSLDYAADRFLWSAVTSAVVDMIKTADAPTVGEAGIFTQNCLHVDITTADASIAAGDYGIISYKIEGYDWAQIAQRQFTISFWVKAAKTGIHCVAFTNSGGDRTYVHEYTIAVSDTWEYFTHTVSASPSAGTWNYGNGIGIGLAFTLAAGSTFHTTADAWNTGNFLSTSNQVNEMDNAANNFKVDLIQVEAGTYDTSFEIRHFADELILCQRYYEKSYDQGVDPGAVTSIGALHWTAANSNIEETFQFAVEKRTNPAVTLYNPVTSSTGECRDLTNGTNRVVTDNSVSGTRNAMIFAAIAVTNDGDRHQGHWTAEAEL